MNQIEWDEAKTALSHVYWIGGGSEAGKSTISARIAGEFGFTYYHGDEEFYRHVDRATEERSPTLWSYCQMMKEGRFLEWFAALSPDEKSDGGEVSGAEDILYAVDDLLAMPTDRPIVVDVFCAHGESLVKVAGRDRLIFLVATDAFQRETIEGLSRRSGKNPDEGYIEAQRLFSEYFRSESKRLGIPLIVTGGRLTVDESYSAVCRLFGLAAAGP